MDRAIPLVAALLALSLAACDRKDPGGETPTPAKTTAGAAREAYDTPGAHAQVDCGELPDETTLQRLLREAPAAGEAGGLASGRHEWAAIVNRSGELCAIAVSTDDPTVAWPGSLAIAKAKAFTANAFSSDTTPLSTARLYTLSQPGHSLWGAAAASPFNPDCLAPPGAKGETGRICGGLIAFGGGVPLYKGNTKVGGLGASGDTACADHEIAKRIRDAAGLNPAKGRGADDIQYSSVDGPSVYAHPLCINTWRDGKKIGEEPPAQGY